MIYDPEKIAKSALSLIKRGKPVSAGKHWMGLSRLNIDGVLTSRVAPNGQLEYLYEGTPVKVGP